MKDLITECYKAYKAWAEAGALAQYDSPYDNRKTVKADDLITRALNAAMQWIDDNPGRRVHSDKSDKYAAAKAAEQRLRDYVAGLEAMFPPERLEYVSQLKAERDALQKRVDILSRNKGGQGCSCTFEDDGETPRRWCALHGALRDERDALRQALLEHHEISMEYDFDNYEKSHTKAITEAALNERGG